MSESPPEATQEQQGPTERELPPELGRPAPDATEASDVPKEKGGSTHETPGKVAENPPGTKKSTTKTTAEATQPKSDETQSSSEKLAVETAKDRQQSPEEVPSLPAERAPQSHLEQTEQEENQVAAKNQPGSRPEGQSTVPPLTNAAIVLREEREEKIRSLPGLEKPTKPGE